MAAILDYKMAATMGPYDYLSPHIYILVIDRDVKFGIQVTGPLRITNRLRPQRETPPSGGHLEFQNSP